MKLNFKKLLPVCLLCLLFPISRVSAGKPGRFTDEQCQAIIQYVEDHGGPAEFCDWERLKRELGLPQTAQQIQHKYTFSLNPRINRGPWTNAEDQAILNGVETHGPRWTLIAKELGTGRTDLQVCDRFRIVLNPNLKKGPFTAEEDQKILAWVAANGPKDWGKCANGPFGNTRSGKRLRERWTNGLNSNLKKGQWTPEEDQFIVWQVKTIGLKWADIAKLLPGRSDNAVKNRWYGKLQKNCLNGNANACRIAWLCNTQLANSGLNFTSNPSMAHPASVTDGSGNNSLPNLNLSEQNPPTAPTANTDNTNIKDQAFLKDFHPPYAYNSWDWLWYNNF